MQLLANNLATCSPKHVATGLLVISQFRMSNLIVLSCDLLPPTFDLYQWNPLSQAPFPFEIRSMDCNHQSFSRPLLTPARVWHGLFHKIQVLLFVLHPTSGLAKDVPSWLMLVTVWGWNPQSHPSTRPCKMSLLRPLRAHVSGYTGFLPWILRLKFYHVLSPFEK